MNHVVTDVDSLHPATHTRSPDAVLCEDCILMLMYRLHEKKSLDSVAASREVVVNCTLFDHTACVYTTTQCVRLAVVSP